jgi:hypothetical protein
MNDPGLAFDEPKPEINLGDFENFKTEDGLLTERKENQVGVGQK